MERQTETRNNSTARRGWRSPGAIALGMLILVISFYVLREHWGHVAGFWPYLLLLACPLLHFFTHGGHKHGG